MRNAWPMYGRIIGTGSKLTLSTTTPTPYAIPANAHGVLAQAHNQRVWYTTDPTQTPLPGTDRGFSMEAEGPVEWLAFDPGQTIYFITEASGGVVWLEPRQAYFHG